MKCQRKLPNELFAALDREQPVQLGFNGDGTGGCSRPVSFPFGSISHAMKPLLTFAFGLVVSCAVDPRAAAQTPAGLDIQVYAGLTITGAVGTVNSIEYVADLAQTNNPSAWCCLEFLQLPATPYLWADKSAPARGKRFYRAVSMAAPTNMVFIPPGTFRMGSPTNEVDRGADEGSQTAVTTSRGFWMGKYEVTQGEYQAVTGGNPSWFNGDRTSAGYGDYGVDLNRPVEWVSWEDATNYCGQLTERERTAGRIPTNCVYRLPTEAEWEYACRAWTSTRFSYGDDPGHTTDTAETVGYTNLTNYSWYLENSGWQTHPVGQKLPNPWGLYDMHGNVWEWCQDWLGPYPGGSVSDPKGPASGGDRVLRGGSWSSLARCCRSADRCDYRPDFGESFGLRVVLASGQP
jgi:formylglycine-generating enzyme required for sulfatase activity